ncbi:hypothetical protein DU500_17215 (plasmid) [Haloplanus rubicundus]|uniref:Gamma-glutamylcyclotransferase AIG2-like domain-containing protein n=1 Tax=Haloplanus rubicundus TaxID=1547898 RepID=A0A345E7R0_9EURY|nr:gamma-glutamylcyclotransferase [Haloplanus rubicundus]AXG08232.1 hypothetical protein DU500_17215 [Haloplanus rubicundus]
MNLPENPNLPLFVYGLFKPGQLGYHRIEPLVQSTRNATAEGKLLERDGVPILAEDPHSQVNGYLLKFDEEEAESAYEKVVSIEPEKQYRWVTRSVSLENGTETANILLGRNPTRGTTELSSFDWSGERDPLFTDALDVVEEVIASETGFDWEDKKPFFRLQMAYLLLWSSIERYISLRYGLRGPRGDQSIRQKLMKMAEEPGFQGGLESIDLTDRPRTQITRADRPQDDEKLDPDNPQGSIDYYYQVRSNLSHRGKTAPVDFDILQHSLNELYEIFRNHVLPRAFDSRS